MVGLTTFPGRPGRLLLLAAMLFSMLGACLAPVQSSAPVDDLGEAIGGTAAQAAGIVEQWLLEASTQTGDYGWSMLFPNVRTDLIHSEEAYRDAIVGADWSKLRYAVGRVSTRDGEYRVNVWVQGGAESIPAPLRRWGLIQFGSTDGVPSDEGYVAVRIDPSGWPWGIQATG